MVALAIILACAAAFRLRGSELWNDLTHTGTTGGRLLWAATLGVSMQVAFDHVFYAWTLPLFVALAFVAAIPGWPDSIDLGRNEGSFLEDFAYHSLRGCLFTTPVALPLCWVSLPAAAVVSASGLAAGCIYELAWRTKMKSIYLREVEMLGTGVPLGEALFGAWIGAAVLVASRLV